MSFTASSAKEKKTIWNQTFLKSDSGEKATKHGETRLGDNLRCSSLIAGLWVTFSFPLRFIFISCASEVEIEHVELL